ncbi:hypothetical protein [Lentibacillus saliphilus]|uniref:hypothetical protein n=1 Tax=Lentibacillus saliphilus TaxID=2737028 RepID=UPI001C30AD16|nr:hypothetical protein [Lentibacillus saliphilus]
MTYRANVFKVLFRMDDHLFRIKQAEKMHNIWLSMLWLIALSIGVYAIMASKGMGTTILSQGAVWLSAHEYEAVKFWFVIGRTGFGFIFAVCVIFIPSLILHYITKIPYQKLLYMQLVVLLLLLLERIIWIPLTLYAGLDWYASPLSLGLIASYLTDVSWVIYFFGAISLIQFGVIWFQMTFIKRLSTVNAHWIWTSIILLHLCQWALAATLASVDDNMLGRWFR